MKMKKRKMKNYLKIGILLFGISFFLWSCEKEDFFKESTEKNIPKKLTIKKIGKTEIKQNKRIAKHLSEFRKEKVRSLSAKNTKDENTGLEINTDYATYIELADGYHSYTFPVTNTPQGEGLQNVLLSLQTDGTYKEYLTHYEISQQEIELLNSGNEIDLKDKYSITEIASEFADNYFNKVIYQDACMIINWTPNTCSSGYHEYGDSTCDFIGDSDPNTSEAQPGGSLTVTNLGCNDTGGGGNTNDSSGNPINTDNENGTSDPNPNGGSNPNNNPITSPTNCIENCISEDDSENTTTECNKIDSLFANNSSLKDKLIALKAKTTDSIESGIFLASNSTDFQNMNVGTNGEVKITIPATGKATMMAHVHNSPASETYSIFSFGDLWGINLALRKEKVDTSKFVAFLSTADGTNYAFTINNPTQFLKVFATTNDTGFDQAVGLNRYNMRQKYFIGDVENNQEPLILENSTDYIKDEKLFLDFLKATNMGLTLFEVNDNFDEFKKVTHNEDTDDIDKENCN